MAMQMNLVLLRGDHLAALESQGLGALGYSVPHTIVDNVPGALIARTADNLLSQAGRPTEVIGMTLAQGWTVIVDPSGLITEDLEGWLAMSARLDTRVISVRCDELSTEFAVFDEGKMRRIVSYEAGEGSTYLGKPLAIEDIWEARLPTVEELLETLACLAIDLLTVNATSLYTLWEMGFDESARDVELLVVTQEAEAVVDNVVQLLWAAS